MPRLENLQINLHLEEEVDYLLRQLPELKILNNIPVERDAIYSETGSQSSARLVSLDPSASIQNMTLNANVCLNIAEDIVNSINAANHTTRTAAILGSERSFEDLAPSGILVMHPIDNQAASAKQVTPWSENQPLESALQRIPKL